MHCEQILRSNISTYLTLLHPYLPDSLLGSPVEPNGVITHYTLYTDYQNGSVTVSTTSATVHTLSPLRPYQTVSVEVSANTSVGEGPRTTSGRFTTDEASEYIRY